MSTPIRFTASVSAATATAGSSTLTASGLLQQMQHVRRMLETDAEASALSGPPRMHESPLALQAVPVKRHKKRRNQTEAYHRRVQKKWTKRHGTKQVPAAYLLDSRVFGGHGQVLVAHPSIVARLKKLSETFDRDQRL